MNVFEGLGSVMMEMRGIHRSLITEVDVL